MRLANRHWIFQCQVPLPVIPSGARNLLYLGQPRRVKQHFCSPQACLPPSFSPPATSLSISSPSFRETSSASSSFSPAAWLSLRAANSLPEQCVPPHSQ